MVMQVRKRGGSVAAVGAEGHARRGRAAPRQIKPAPLQARADGLRQGQAPRSCDPFAYRNPYPAARLQVFEVDHPATQAWKRGLLAQAQIETPPSLHFVPIDFETQALPRALDDAGFDATRPTFYSWLGVTMYLER